MQIKSTLAAAVAITFMIQAWTAGAADQDSRDASEIFILQERTEDMPKAKTEVKSEDVPEDATGEQPMTKPRKQMKPVSVRNTRPQKDAHKDARTCLKARKNELIIRCAQKYR